MDKRSAESLEIHTPQELIDFLNGCDESTQINVTIVKESEKDYGEEKRNRGAMQS